jgi:N-acetylmuramoyl-L-alanine amidase
MSSRRTIYLIAGHDLQRDLGAVAYDGTREAVLTAELRDLVAQQLNKCARCGGSTETDNDSLDLARTIQAINGQARPTDFVLDIHFNHNHPTATGTEVFHFVGTSALNIARARTLSKAVAGALGLADRGAKPDTQTAVGSLGILRFTPCPALLLEVCFLNAGDLTRYRARKLAVATAISDFLKNL